MTTATIPPNLREMFEAYSDKRLAREIKDARARLAEAEPFEATNFHAARVADCARRHIAAMETILEERHA